MDTEKVKQLANNVRQLIALHKEREENIKKLIRMTLSFIPGSKEYVKLNLSRDPHQQKQYAEKRKQLIEALEDYINQGDNHVKS